MIVSGPPVPLIGGRRRGGGSGGPWGKTSWVSVRRLGRGRVGVWVLSPKFPYFSVVLRFVKTHCVRSESLVFLTSLSAVDK